MVIINIRDKETRKLVKKLSKLTGESITTAVIEAVRERLELVRLPRSRGSPGGCSKSAATALLTRRPTENYRESLYDETGLPR